LLSQQFGLYDKKRYYFYQCQHGSRQWYCTAVNLHFKVMFEQKWQRKWLPRKRTKEREVAVEATREAQVAAVHVSLNGDDSHE
jgi:hypothetical protein